MTKGILVSCCLPLSVLSIPLTLLAAHQPPSGPPIDAVAAKYALIGHSFEFGSDGAVGVRLEYTYPGTYMTGDDSDRGPGAKTVAVPGLSYDSRSRSVVYHTGETSTVCATLHGTSHLKPTGQCRIEAHVVRSNRDDSRGRDMLDIFLRVMSR